MSLAPRAPGNRPESEREPSGRRLLAAYGLALLVFVPGCRPEEHVLLHDDAFLYETLDDCARSRVPGPAHPDAVSMAAQPAVLASGETLPVWARALPDKGGPLCLKVTSSAGEGWVMFHSRFLERTR